MKTNIFSFNRLGLLFQRYFTERSRTELIYWSIMAIVFMLIRNNPPLMAGLIIIAGVFYAARFFREIHSRSNGVAYFMIPATHLEKLTVGIVMTSFYYFAMMIIAYIIGNLLGTLLNNILASMNFSVIGINIFYHSSLQWKMFITDSSYPFANIGHRSYYLFLFFLFGQSVYLLGSTYFKNNQFLKTFLATNIIQLCLFILFAIKIWLFIGNGGLTIENTSYDFSMMVGKILRYIIYFLTPFFWVVSYFRLTEKQV